MNARGPGRDIAHPSPRAYHRGCNRQIGSTHGRPAAHPSLRTAASAPTVTPTPVTGTGRPTECARHRDQRAGETRQCGRADKVEAPGRVAPRAAATSDDRVPTNRGDQQQGSVHRDPEHDAPIRPCGDHLAHQRSARWRHRPGRSQGPGSRPPEKGGGNGESPITVTLAPAPETDRPAPHSRQGRSGRRERVSATPLLAQIDDALCMINYHAP